MNKINLGGGKKIRACVYARVSVGNEDTEMSLTSQMKGFMTIIDADPRMELAGVYADEGVTGTSLKRAFP